MKKLLILFGLVGTLAAAGLMVLRFIDTYAHPGRMRETPAIRPHEAPMLRVEPGAVPVTGGEALLRATPAVELQPPLDLDDPRVIDSGKTVYFTYCVQCHGPDHDGNGTVGQSFSPLPTDLRSAKVQNLSPGAHFKEISYGIPGGRQPPLATTISILDRWRVTAYVASLGRR